MSLRASLTITIVGTGLVIAISGCDERVADVAREGADRQAQQNAMTADLHGEVAQGTRALVTSDAEARDQIVSVHHELQAERARLDEAWSALERERQRLTERRHTESLLVASAHVAGMAILVVLLLLFSWYALFAARHDNVPESALNEYLLATLVGDEHRSMARPDRLSLPSDTTEPGRQTDA